MMKRFVLCLLVGLVLLACGCGYNDTATQLSEGGTYEVVDYVDPETGVHYLLLKFGRGSGMCPRYNADGTLMVDDIA